MSDQGTKIVAEIRELIRAGEFDLALDRIKAVSHGSSPRLYEEVVLLQARSSRLTRDYRTGIITRDIFETDLNRLTISLQSLAEELSRALPKAQEALDCSVFAETSGTFPQLTPQQIIRINNLKQISWIGAGVNAVRSVCRVLTPGGFGTGFLVGDGILMTNNHVIGSVEKAGQSKAEFDYQPDDSGSFLPSVRYEIDPSNFHSRFHELLLR